MTLAGIRYRAFSGPDDFPAMAACANACFRADGVETIRTAADMARDYAAFTTCTPVRDVWIAQAAGDIAGYVRGWHWQQADGLRLYGQLGLVAPHWRRRGIGTTLLAWLEGRQRALAAELPPAGSHAHHAYVQEGEQDRAALLRKHGYHAERSFHAMVRPTLDDIADFPLPPGVELRPAQQVHYRTIWDAHVQAFDTHWGHVRPTEADYQHWLRCPEFQPHLWQVAWDVATNEVAGQVRGYVSESFNANNRRKRGWTEFISVGHRWRRQGLARALISHSLRAQRAAGMDDSGLGVDGTNLDGANRVYAACGFVVAKRNTVYRKPLVPAA